MRDRSTAAAAEGLGPPRPVPHLAFDVARARPARLFARNRGVRRVVHRALAGERVVGDFEFDGAHRSVTRNSRPTALAYFSSEVVEGSLRPLSMRATADWEVPMRRATWACESLAFARAPMSSRASANSASRASYSRLTAGFFRAFFLKASKLLMGPSPSVAPTRDRFRAAAWFAFS